MNKAIFISARCASSRLPNKAVLDIHGKPAIQWLVENLKKSEHKTILCTTKLSSDDKLCKLAQDLNLEYFRGSSEDKLERWRGACAEFKIDAFVNVDADDLFLDHKLADIILKQIDGVDFVDGHGLYNDIYGISSGALEKVCEIKSTKETEYIRPYFTETGIFKVRVAKNIPDLYLKKGIRMTLDYEDDLLFFKEVIENVRKLNLKNILSFLRDNPETININLHLEKEWGENQKSIIKKFSIKDI